MIVAFARKLMLFHLSSPIFDGFFSMPSSALCVPSFTSNDVTHIFNNRKLDFPSNFSTSNLVVVIVLPTITLIPIVDDLLSIKQQKNTELETQQRKRKRKRCTTSKQLKLNHHTTKSIRFNVVRRCAYIHGEERNFY